MIPKILLYNRNPVQPKLMNLLTLYSIAQKLEKLHYFFKILLDFYKKKGYHISCCRDKCCNVCVRVAQLDRATGYGPVGRGFESCHARCED